MVSSLISNSGNSLRLLHQARGYINTPSCSNGGGSCCCTISVRARRREQSLTLSSAAPFHSKDSSQIVHNRGALISSTSMNNRQKISESMCTKKRTIYGNNNLRESFKFSKIFATQTLNSGPANSEESHNFLMSIGLASLATGLIFYSSMSKKTTMSEPSKKTTTVATSAVAATLLNDINVDISKEKILSTASSLGVGMREAVTSYHSQRLGEKMPYSVS